MFEGTPQCADNRRSVHQRRRVFFFFFFMRNSACSLEPRQPSNAGVDWYAQCRAFSFCTLFSALTVRVRRDAEVWASKKEFRCAAVLRAQQAAVAVVEMRVGGMGAVGSGAVCALRVRACVRMRVCVCVCWPIGEG